MVSCVPSRYLNTEPPLPAVILGDCVPVDVPPEEPPLEPPEDEPPPEVPPSFSLTCTSMYALTFFGLVMPSGRISVPVKV